MKKGLYKFLRVLAKILMKGFYRVEIIGKENIPKEGSCLLCGNHKSNLDPILLMAASNRLVHFVAKKELTDGKFGFFFKKLGLIPVDRSKKNPQVINECSKLLNEGEVVGIFPEGTFNKTEYVIMPFKIGAVKMSNNTDAPIVPFAIVNNYKLFRKSAKIIFGKPYHIKDKLDLRKENITLMNKVIKLLKNENN